MRTLIFICLLSTFTYAQADKDINYDFLELGYGYLDLSNNITPGGFYLDGVFDFSEHFYIGGLIDHRDSRGVDFNRHNLSLGFHSNGPSNTDFYAQLSAGRLKTGNLDGKTLGLFAGTRTAFNDRFELVTKIGFTNLDEINHDDGNNLIIYEAEVKGLFKFSKNQAITTGIESYDRDFGAKIGYRYSF